ncbi:MAG: ABC transporter ATP-binding protein/permease [Methanomassiliicoccaceae archaeon]|nr:ABC transporter ATP-binding protein/permease [Methanomassiliicoccaceae archaeon]
MFKIISYLRPKEWAMIGVILVLIVIQVWLDLKLPEYMGEITMLITSPIPADVSDVWSIGLKMLMCAFGSLAAAIAVGFLASRIASSYARTLRSLQFSKVDSFSMAEINKFSTASLITRSTNDVTQIQMVVTMGLQIIIKAPILAVWALMKISNKGFEWTIVTGVAVLILLLLFAFLFILVIPKFRKMQSLTDNINRVARENLTGLPVVRAYNAEEHQKRKFEAANDELTGTHMFTSRAMAVMMPAIGLIMNGLLLSVYWIGAILIDGAAGLADKRELFADMIVFSSYSMQILMAFMMITILFIMLPRAQVSARRINEVLDTEPSVTDGSMTGDTPKKGEVEFRNVGFRYPGAADHVLKDISFIANRGETVAFIGSTGSGKSTIINLVPRFYDVTEGSVLVDGIDVREYSLDALHNKIGYVPQKAVLFSGTVTSNVAFGDNGMESATEDDVKNAVRIAQGADFVEKMENTYDAAISRGGSNISGGQKQRLSIARAVCRRPEIYIFDDSFSALDYRTDRDLRTALKKETEGVTSLIVAQRIGTIMDADMIVVLDNGMIVGTGTHRELLEKCEVYKEIAMSQLSEEELAS